MAAFVDSPVDSRKVKLASTVAAQIIADITSSGRPAGDVIGSEAELIEQYGVSRATFREAVRLVEHQHVGRMRRGPGGGLVVAEPDLDAVLSAAILYLARVDTPLDEIFDARVVIEEIVAEIAPPRLEEADISLLRDHIAAEADGTASDHRRLHSLLAQSTRNPALELFVEALTRMTTFYLRDPTALTQSALDESIHAHAQITGAIITNRPDLARQRMGRHLRAEAAYIRKHRSGDQRLQHALALEETLGSKRAEGLASVIFASVVDARLEPGTFLGSEAELMERHDVSRAIFREAVRLLEHHHVALMRRGPRGGLFVAAPSAASVAAIVALYLRRHGITTPQLADVRLRLEVALVDIVSRRSTDEQRAELRERLGAEYGIGDKGAESPGRDFHAVLAELAGNRALELLQFVLHRLALTELNPAMIERLRGALPETVSAHRTIAQALIDGDRELALHRMRQHLLDEARVARG